MMITGYASVEGAVEAIKAGAEEYLAKPFTDDELEQAIERSLEKLSIRADRKSTPARSMSKKYNLIDESEAMKKVSGLIRRAAGSEHPVLLLGEPGSGKELAARIIHYESSRSSCPFVYINCRDIPESILENEIYGYVSSDKIIQPGFLELAGRGTVYLDEISATSLAVQIKLLDVLTKNELTCVGDNTARPVSCRIIASTSRDLITLAGKGLFREDLLFRLNVINIAIPPLRERKDDLLPFCNEQLTRECHGLGRSVPPIISEAVSKLLLLYDWPGNARELNTLINSLAARVEGDTIEVSDLPGCIRFIIDAENKVKKSLQEIQTEHIREVLQSCDGNKSKAAQILGIDRKTLRDKLGMQD
jgi:DNA-binding NtrC family response regulator